MNKIFVIMVCASIAILCFTVPQNFLDALSTSSAKAVTFSITMIGTYAVWMGIFNILEDTKILDKLQKPFSPIVRLIFGKVDKESAKYLTTNLTSSLLGIGGISVSSGAKATSRLSGDGEIISRPAAILAVLSAAFTQAFPTTMISIRQAAGSLNAADIFLPALITTLATSVFAVLLTKLAWRLFPPTKEFKLFKVFKRKGKSSKQTITAI